MSKHLLGTRNATTRIDEPARDHAIPSEAQRQLGRQLRKLYGSLAVMPLPLRFRELLDELAIAGPDAK